MPATDEIARRIVADFAVICAGLEAIAPPAGHRWVAPPSELTWSAGDVLASTLFGGASIYLRRFPPDDYDPDQLHIELRVFWNKSPGEAQELNHMRAILWAQHGVRIAFQSRSLFPESPLYLYPAHAEDLTQQVRSILEEAFQRFVMSTPRNETH